MLIGLDLMPMSRAHNAWMDEVTSDGESQRKLRSSLNAIKNDAQLSGQDVCFALSDIERQRLARPKPFQVCENARCSVPQHPSLAMFNRAD